MNEQAWDKATFEKALRARGVRYHIHHPFHQMMYRGELDQKQIQGWVANRFYYQQCIPLKDANFLAKCPDRAVRRRWIERLIDHDGRAGGEGGIEAWVRLGEAVGLARDEVVSGQHVLPGVRFAVDAYVHFVREAPWAEGACSSLTELFAPVIHQQRLDTWPDRYPWFDPAGLEYFRGRIKLAHRDVEHGLALTLELFDTRAKQDRALEILQFKLDVLWSMLDAMYMAYVNEMPPYFNTEPVPADPGACA